MFESAQAMWITDANLDFLRLGGRLKFEVLTSALFGNCLNHSIPIITCLGAT
jgi:hypothetical protein